MNFSKITTTGSYLPEKILSNLDLEKLVDTSDAWITQRTGIQHRHVAQAHETTAFMGAQAARLALDEAGLTPKDIDLILVATCSPEQIFPSTACLIQEALSVPPCAAFDVQAACTGFIYALSTADQFIRTGQVRRALVIGVEAMSRVIDWKDRATCVLFGDGAGAVILEATDHPGVLSTCLKANGAFKDILYLNNAKMADDSFLRMEGYSVFRQAVKWLSEIASETIAANNLSPQDIDWIIPHQANIRIIKSTAKKIGLPMNKVVVTLHDHANTSGASIPMALDRAIRDGRIQKNQYLLLEAFGGGLTWGSALIKY